MINIIYILVCFYAFILTLTFICVQITIKQKDTMDKKIIMDDYDAGFADATKLMEKKLDEILSKYRDILKKYDYIEEARDVELLEEVKQKLFEK